ncbi:MAG: hypothetical protein M1823_002293 [Watsoniomyces obsoletus]|nr:MAG: hypothetical protein M1823_002293 [Watsoniomyces obsoletus]
MIPDFIYQGLGRAMTLVRGFVSGDRSIAAEGNQSSEATEQERETRNFGHFDEMEHSLPMLPYRIPPGRRILETLGSYFGPRNPFSSTFHPVRDEVWLFDNTAFRPTPAWGSQAPIQPRWKAEFVAAFFRKGSGKNLGEVVADLVEKLGIAKGSEEEARVAERLQPFVDAILPARTIEVVLNAGEGSPASSSGGAKLKLGPSGRSGIISELRVLPSSPDFQQFQDGTVMTTRAKKLPREAMQTRFSEPEGWTIISDVDDTIKVTMTNSPLGILRTTFVDLPQPVAGMPELYQHINTRFGSPGWFYLSASPYNLYPFLHGFREQYYPLGTIILRDASWMTLGGFLTSLTVGTQAYKVSRMEKIHEWFPRRKIICIGDSTQTDPESYAEMYRKQVKGGEGGREWIKAIFIRKVMDIEDQESKNEDQRFEKAFRDVPRNVWRTFEDPAELWEVMDQLAASS